MLCGSLAASGTAVHHKVDGRINNQIKHQNSSAWGLTVMRVGTWILAPQHLSAFILLTPSFLGIFILLSLSSL